MTSSRGSAEPVPLTPQGRERDISPVLDRYELTPKMSKLLRIFNKLLCIAWLNIKYTYLYCCRHAVILNVYVDDAVWKGVRAQNWGDDLNLYLLSRISTRPLVFRRWFWIARLFPLRNYLCIGTILDARGYSNPQSIVWGSGISGENKPMVKPAKIISVRGELSRAYCMEHGLGQPTSVGDPALLLPCYYQPKPLPKRYRLGIVLHTIDSDSEVVAQMMQNNRDILVIRMMGYEKWTDVVDGICSCEGIASSSLHGLIAADAYGVPNCWIRLENVLPSFYKFHDYASSVGRKDLEVPLHVTQTYQVNEIISRYKEWCLPQINREVILTSCPFV